MKRVFEVQVLGDAKMTVRMEVKSIPGEMRFELNRRATRLADTIGATLAERYGASKIVFTKR